MSDKQQPNTQINIQENTPLVLRTDILSTTSNDKEKGATVATLTLNRPKQFNALSLDMIIALQAELDSIADSNAIGNSTEDSSIRVVVIEANGKAFCAGHNLKEMQANPDKVYYQSLFKQCVKLMMTIGNMPQVVIAKVDGIATAAGCQLVAACDLAVASDTSKFATSGINMGLFCSTPAVAVSRNLSRKQAFEMLITGEFIDADTALHYGLVNRIDTADQLEQTLQQLVSAITSKSSVATAIGKNMFYKQLTMPLPQAYEYASEVMADNMMTQDVSEGLDAFVNKRHPVWQGC